MKIAKYPRQIPEETLVIIHVWLRLLQNSRLWQAKSRPVFVPNAGWGAYPVRRDPLCLSVIATLFLCV